MEPKLREIDARLDELTHRLERLERTVEGAVPGGLASSLAVPAAAAQPAQNAESVLPDSAQWVRGLTLVGRTFLALGGAFLIRALTDGGVVPKGVGVLMGLTFAAAFIAFAFKDARGGAAASATMHGATAAVISYPLVFEAVTRLGAFTSTHAALALLAVNVALGAVAFRGRLTVLSWIAVAANLSAIMGFVIAGAANAALLIAITLCAWALVWAADAREWKAVQWPLLLLAQLLLLREVFVHSRADLPKDAALWTTLGMACFGAMLSAGWLAYRTLWRQRTVRVFEAVASFGALAVCTAAVVRSAAVFSFSTAGAGVLALLLSACAFACALYVVPQRPEHGWDHVFYGGLGVVLVFAGGALITDGVWRALLWGALALGAALLGRRMQQTALWMDAAALAWGAAVSSGLLALVHCGLSADVKQAWTAPTAQALVVLALALLSYAATALPRPESPWSARVPAAGLLLLDTLAVAALGTSLTLGTLAFLHDDAAALAAARTLAVALASFALATLWRKVGRKELAWIAYVLLALGGLKLVVEDLRYGRALTLLISFAAYGAALIAVPRLVRTSAWPSPWSARSPDAVLASPPGAGTASLSPGGPH